MATKTAEFTTITSQPLSANAPITTATYATDVPPIDPQPPLDPSAVTIQPLLNPENEGQEKPFSQFNPTTVPPVVQPEVDKTEEACWFCIPFCECLECILDCGNCCRVECCNGCCVYDGFCCCEACCEAGDAAGAIDGAEIADCCGSCFECCSN